MVKINNTTSKVVKTYCSAAQVPLLVFFDSLSISMTYQMNCSISMHIVLPLNSGLYIGSCSQSFLLKNDLMSLQIWSETHFLLLISRKCHYLLFKGQLSLSPEIYSDEIAKCTQNTDLGLVVSNNLKWTAHIETKLARANRTFQMLKKNASKSI